MTVTALQPAPRLLQWQVELKVRLLGVQASDRLWGWIGPLAVAAIGGFLRFWKLDRPHHLVFDETYYVKQGVSYLKVGYELAGRTDLKKPDDLFNRGNTNVFATTPDFVVHPPVGKWMISVGEMIFGTTNPWGWRFSSAVCGTGGSPWPPPARCPSS